MLCAVLAVIDSSPAAAKTPASDWKLYGEMPDDGDALCFYDAKSVAQKTDGHTKFWTKCLSKNAMEKVDVNAKLKSKILKITAKKLHQHYLPPYMMMETGTSDRIDDVIRYETMADLGNFVPQSRIFYDLDCAEQVIKELKTFIGLEGKITPGDKPSDWELIAPKTNAARLLKILCETY